MPNKFLKLKSAHTGENVLVAADAVAFVHKAGTESIITIKSTGEEVAVKESYQTVVNRLTKGDDAEASA